MFDRLTHFLRRMVPLGGFVQVPSGQIQEQRPVLQPIGFNDFLSIDLPARKMLLSPILPE
jgi:hypothetical protein